MGSKNEVKKVIAVVTAYHAVPDSIAALLARLSPQVKKVIIVDDGSSEENVSSLRKVVASFEDAVLLENKSNRGIAAALNVGVACALEDGAPWVLTLDDDSLPPADMIEKMLDVYDHIPEEQKVTVGILAPNYTTLRGPVYHESVPTVLPTAITSGQLIKEEVFQKVGFFNEDLFIECVDHEFCFRLIGHHLQTLLIPSVILEQRVGSEPARHTFLGKQFIVPHYKPYRYYYIFRNSVYVYKKYFTYVPMWVVRNMLMNAMVLAKIVFIEENKRAKVSMILRGLFDGMRSRLGKLDRTL